MSIIRSSGQNWEWQCAAARNPGKKERPEYTHAIYPWLPTDLEYHEADPALMLYPYLYMDYMGHER